MLSKRSNGKSAISFVSSSTGSKPTDSPAAGGTNNPIAKSITSKHTNERGEPTPSVVTIEKSLKTEENESAPIFALFHGKIVPLGKLPDTSFRKSHMEVHSDSKKNEENEKVKNNENDEVKSEIRDPSRSNEASVTIKGPERREQERTLTPSQFSRLSSYFHNLEAKKKDAVRPKMTKSYKKDVTGTVKDEVPELLPSVKNEEFLKHVKSVILDDGKMVTLKDKPSQVEDQVIKEYSYK